MLVSLGLVFLSALCNALPIKSEFEQKIDQSLKLLDKIEEQLSNRLALEPYLTISSRPSADVCPDLPAVISNYKSMKSMEKSNEENHVFDALSVVIGEIRKKCLERKLMFALLFLSEIEQKIEMCNSAKKTHLWGRKLVETKEIVNRLREQYKLVDEE
jgi:hypothetical protein